MQRAVTAILTVESQEHMAGFRAFYKTSADSARSLRINSRQANP